MIALDTSFVVLLLQPGVAVPVDAQGQPVSQAKERIEHYFAGLSKAGVRILVPTPALSEFLVGVRKNHDKYVESLHQTYGLKVGPFDERAAIECALLTDSDLDSARPLGPTETKAKVKFDRQIVAIAKVNSVDTICTEDDKLAACAQRNGLKVLRVADLPLPPQDVQMGLTLEQQPAAPEPGP